MNLLSHRFRPMGKGQLGALLGVSAACLFRKQRGKLCKVKLHNVLYVLRYIITKKGEQGGARVARSALRSLFWFTREMQGLPIDFTSALVKITVF